MRPFSHLMALQSVLTILILTGCSSDADRPENQAESASTEASASPTPADSSRLSLDWNGTYSGVLPCASCPGIETVITLRKDGTFERSLRYIDESPTPVHDTGTFTWDAEGRSVALQAENEETHYYQVGEHRLFQLDMQGQRIQSELADHYILEQHLHDPAIEDRRWRLVELQGQPPGGDGNGRQPFLLLRSEDWRAHGNSSCNTFNGPYAIKRGQRIEFGNSLGMTKMACADIETEQAFMDVLLSADNYSIGEDGSMSLNRARMAPLARFIEEDTDGNGRQAPDGV